MEWASQVLFDSDKLFEIFLLSKSRLKEFQNGTLLMIYNASVQLLILP